jgi:hypothetical protein
LQEKQVELNECDKHSQKPSELDNELDSMTFHSETVESRSEHGSAIGNQQTYYLSVVKTLHFKHKFLFGV